MQNFFQQLIEKLRAQPHWLWSASVMVIGLTMFGTGYWTGRHLYPKVLGESSPISSVNERPEPKDKDLLQYTLQNLQGRQYQVSEIKIERQLAKFPEYTSYLFSFKTLGKKMTGQLNVPNQGQDFPIIVMVRGYVDAKDYSTGVGTAPAAAELAKQGYLTIAPDFFGFGGSEPEAPGWEARFQKPINVVELIKSLQANRTLSFKDKNFSINPSRLGIWAHSNGGQISLTVLEILGEPIPTTLWAPVTAPFPYSVLYFSDEYDDEGKSTRSAIAGLEQEYDAQEFSLTQYLHRMTAPLQIHQGTADDAVPKTWSDEFISKMTKENQRRAKVVEEMKVAQQLQQLAEASAAAQSTASATASGSAEASAAAIVQPSPQVGLQTKIEAGNIFLNPIDISYFIYPGANHSIRPGWDTAIARDLAFFSKHL